MTFRCVLLLSAFLAAPPVQAHPGSGNPQAHLHGTSIFHWMIRDSMHYLGPETDRPPIGTMTVRHVRQGRADNQHLILVLRRLQPSTTHHLLVQRHGDEDYSLVETFETTRYGTAVFRQKKIGSSQGSGVGHEKYKLHDLFNPIEELEKIAVADGEMNLLLESELDNPTRFHILVRRELENQGQDESPEAVLFLKANHVQTWFRLHVGGLDADSPYRLVLNGETDEAETITTDTYGRFNGRTYLDYARDVLDLKRIEIRDGEDHVILGADLP